MDNHFRRFVDGMRDGVAIEQGGAVSYANSSFIDLLGLDGIEQALGRPLSDLLAAELPDEELQRIRVALEAARTQGDGTVTELRFGSNRSPERAFEANIGTQNGEAAPALVFTLKEVPSVRGVRAALEHADRLASLGTLAAGVAHEINNPLAYVVSNLGYSIEQLTCIGSLLGDTDLPQPLLGQLSGQLARVVEALDEAGEGTDRVTRIVQGLKSFSRSDDDSRGTVDLQGVLESAISMAENEIRYRARLERNFQQTPMVFGNEARLIQVFVNVLVNAAQAIPEGNPERHCIRIFVGVSPAGMVVSEVSDTGMGIPRDMLDRVFDPFFTTKPIGAGTGLGLSICHGLVHGLGGSISVASEEKRGTTVHIELLPAELKELEPPLNCEPAGSPRGELLIIDDEPLVLRAFRRTLAAHHNILTVSDARKALALIEKGQEFDLIFCDLMMPGMTGMDFHAVLHGADPQLAERVVFLTGGAFTSSARDYLNSVSNRALEKPLHPRALRNFVSKALS